MLMFSRLRQVRQACRSSVPLSSKEKTRATMTLLKTEKNPERILDICWASTINLDTNLYKFALPLAIFKLSESNYFEGIHQLLDELKTRPDLRNEHLCRRPLFSMEANMLDHAIRSFKQMDDLGIPRSAKSLDASIFACVLAKNCKEVSRIYLEFPKIYGIEPNIDVYNSVITAFCESGSSSSVYSILAEMDKKNMKRNAITFVNMLSGFYMEEKRLGLAELTTQILYLYS